MVGRDVEDAVPYDPWRGYFNERVDKDARYAPLQIIRGESEHEYRCIWQYIDDNPVKRTRRSAHRASVIVSQLEEDWYKIHPTAFRRYREPVREKGLPSEGGDSMPKGKKLLPDKKEERDLLTQVRILAPLFDLIIRILELILKILRIIN